MKVLKFGGTSVGTIQSLKNVKQIIESLDQPAIIVVSALGGLTDRLIATAHAAARNESDIKDSVNQFKTRHFDIIDALIPAYKQQEVKLMVSELLDQLEQIYRGVSLIGDLSERTLDMIVSFGERCSSIIVANMINGSKHHNTLSFIKTEKWFNRNIADRALTERNIKEEFTLPLNEHAVIGGFISEDRDTHEITNLGRGGSDYTAALVAAALNAEMLEIWTDVDGFMTSDPRIIHDAKIIDQMSFIESMELCSFGAKVIYPPTIYPVFHKNIPIKILNTFNPSAPGTLITDTIVSKGIPKGISSLNNMAIISISGQLTTNVAEINSRAYNAMARNGISVFLVAQPDNDLSFSITMRDADAPNAREALSIEFEPEIQSGKVETIEVETGLSIIAIVGEAIRQAKGLGPRLVNTLQRANINVKAISDGTSDTTIALLVAQEDVTESLKLIHSQCF